MGLVVLDLTSLAYQPNSRVRSARPKKHVTFALSEQKSYPAHTQELDDDDDDEPLVSPDRSAASEDEDDKPLVQPASREEPVRRESAAERSSAGRPTRRAPTSPSPMFTSTTSALSGGIFASRLLLIRNLHTKVGAVVPTGDFNKGAERELASKRPHRPALDRSTRSRLQPRQCSEAYFWCYAIVGPWRSAPRLHEAQLLRVCQVPEPVARSAP